MMHMPPWKMWTIIVVCVLGVVFSAPNLLPRDVADSLPWYVPHRQISLGLDLQGGSHLLLEVDTSAVAKERLESIMDQVRGAMRTARIVITNLASDGTSAVTFKVRDANQLEAARNAVRDLDRAARETTTPDGTITLRLDPPTMLAAARNAVTQSIEIVRRRIDETGTKEPLIQAQGQNRILVQLPGVDDPERIKKILGQTAKMNFHLVDTTCSMADARANRCANGAMLLPGDRDQEQYVVQRTAVVSGDRLTDAQPGPNSQTGQWVVNFKFDGTGARQFGNATRENVGKQLAIVLDGRVISAPVIREPIPGGSGQISGNFTVASATDLSVLLRAGALPAPLKIIEERSVGPELGADSIRAGITAVIIGFVLVVIYMAAAYGLFGVFADVALIVNLFLVLAVMSLLQATLTLPGIAGILLTVGMSVDANVLINERIREETRLGKTPIAALEAGFERAMSTIVDANMTTIIKMMLLYVFGSGPVKGFAVTITIGIITSFFTATLLVRLMIWYWVRTLRPKLLPV